jgi:hypothetical protein
MDTLGIDTSPEEIDLMIHEIDQDSNGEIDFDEFVAVMSRKVNATYTSEQVKTAFRAFEGTGSAPGFIKADRLLLALTTYGADKISPEQAHELISQVSAIALDMMELDDGIRSLAAALLPAGTRSARKHQLRRVRQYDDVGIDQRPSWLIPRSIAPRRTPPASSCSRLGSQAWALALSPALGGRCIRWCM